MSRRTLRKPTRWTPDEWARSNTPPPTAACPRCATSEALEASIADLGGISGAESKVRLTFDWLSPAQRSQAERKIAAWAAASGTTETAVAVNLAEVLGRTHDAAKLARGLREGPGGL